MKKMSKGKKELLEGLFEVIIPLCVIVIIIFFTTNTAAQRVTQRNADRKKYLEQLEKEGYVICYVSDTYSNEEYLAGISKKDFDKFVSGQADKITIKRPNNSDYDKEEIFTRSVDKIKCISIKRDR